MHIEAEDFTCLDLSLLSLIYKWRSLYEIRKWMSDSKPFSFDDHLNFCKRLKDSASKRFFLIKLDEKPCGVQTVNIDGTKAELGCYFINRDDGIAYKSTLFLIDYFKELGINNFHCKILKNNIVSQKFYEKVGMRLSSEDETYYFYNLKAFPFEDFYKLKEKALFSVITNKN